jgi:hypothetical protein
LRSVGHVRIRTIDCINIHPTHTTRQQIEPLALANFPADVAFHPHGIYFHRCVHTCLCVFFPNRKLID